MAITNAQQFKQLVNPPMDGKRPGYRGEAAAASDTAGDRDAGRSDTGSASGRGDGPDSSGPTRNPMAQFDFKPPTPLYDEFGPPSTTNFNFMDQARKTVNPFGFLTDLPGGIGFVSRALTPNPFGFSSTGPTNTGGGKDGSNTPYWAQLGFNSEQEYLNSLTAQGSSDTDQESKEKEPFEFYRRFRADGGIMNTDVVGGEMDFESARQMYGLGKFVKKITRSVKKIAKSPIGKAALIGAIGFGIPGTSLGGIFGRASFGGAAPGMFGFGGIGNALAAGKAKFLTKAPIDRLAFNAARTAGSPSSSLLDMVGGKVGLGILGASTLAGALTPQQEEEAQMISDNTGIDIAEIRANPNKYLARRFQAEGGIMRTNYANGSEDAKEEEAPDLSNDPNYKGWVKVYEASPEAAEMNENHSKYLQFYNRKAEGGSIEGEGIMKMASAPTLEDSINEMKEMLARDFFGKPLGNLSDDELLQIDEMLENMSKIEKNSSSIKLAEGGKPEPVAKKTMPLLDMGGKEMDLRAEGGFVPIGRMEKADDVPARLSKNEFVFTAEAVRNAGEGDVDKGAEVMYNMMKNLESGGEVSEESQGLEGARKMFQTSQRLEEVL